MVGLMPVASFEAAYREHFAAVWRVVRRLGIPEKDAVDAAQEVFVIAYRRWHEFEGRSSTKTWLFGIAYRVAAGRRRSAPSKREVIGEDALHGAEPLLDAVREQENRELMRLLERVLDRLPIEQRVVFTLFEMEGMTGDEIAEALELPAGTVRSRLRLARRAFEIVLAKLRPAAHTAKAAGGAG
jgi:RNA polymerase sigma-70 factor (ECF subfamily)